ncbi:hypothetical protein VP01_3337g1 [Puccinia sorghi]|uniref:Uncharacterized protein n=1 Tax=Puccinia sorghi TaxID=27349 RepID=A0A0L6UX61_9BASI|nr:hypothetical protein VP01_3337g1 [Puccinia sorghi]
MSDIAWYPFPLKEAIVGSLILGRLHTIMSRSMYLQVRSSLSMCDVILPHWESIRIMMARFHELLKLTMIENFGVLNTQCFCLSIKDILQNATHLNFYPHETYGKNAFASYQSMKWLAHLERKYRESQSYNCCSNIFLQPSRYDICKMFPFTNNQRYFSIRVCLVISRGHTTRRLQVYRQLWWSYSDFAVSLADQKYLEILNHHCGNHRNGWEGSLIH